MENRAKLGEWLDGR